MGPELRRREWEDRERDGSLASGFLLPGRRLLPVVIAVALALIALQEIVTRTFDASLATVDEIIESSSPSVVAIGDVGRAAREIRAVALRLEDAPVATREAARPRLLGMLDNLEARVGAYRRYAISPNETQHQRELDDGVARLRSAVGSFVLSPPGAPVRDCLRDALSPAADDVEREVAEIAEVNAQNAASAARSIIRNHARTSELSLVLLLGIVAVLVFVGLLAQRGLRIAERELERRMHELDAFAARVSHDLKGPLAPATVAVTLLRKLGGLGPDAERYVEAIDRSCSRVNAVVDGLLAFARARAADVAARASVEDVVSDLAPSLELLAQGERARLVFSVEKGLEVQASRVVVGSILENLARNALLYLGAAPERRVTVRARASGETAVLEVEDTGPGIEPEVLARLFQPFARGSARPGGTGLGLATVKRLAESHGGSVGVRSEVGRGSTFEVRLPLSGKGAGDPLPGRPQGEELNRGPENRSTKF